MFIAALFMIARTWKQPGCPSTDEWLKKIDTHTHTHIHTHIYNINTVGYSVQFSSVAQSCPPLCDPMNRSTPGPSVHGILQARTLERVANPFSKAWKWKGKVKPLSSVWLLATPWTAAHQALLSMGFSRQEYSSGLPLPSPIMILSLVQSLSRVRLFETPWIAAH